MQGMTEPYRNRNPSYPGYYPDEAPHLQSRSGGPSLAASVPHNNSQKTDLNVLATQNPNHSTRVLAQALTAFKSDQKVSQPNQDMDSVWREGNSSLTERYIDPYDNVRHELWQCMRTAAVLSQVTTHSSRRRKFGAVTSWKEDGLDVSITSAPSFFGQGFTYAYYGPQPNNNSSALQDDGPNAEVTRRVGKDDDDELVDSEDDMMPATFAAAQGLRDQRAVAQGSLLHTNSIMEGAAPSARTLPSGTLEHMPPPEVQTGTSCLAFTDALIGGQAAAQRLAAGASFDSNSEAASRKSGRKGMRELRGIQEDLDRKSGAADRLRRPGPTMVAMEVDNSMVVEQRAVKRSRIGQDALQLLSHPSPSPRDLEPAALEELQHPLGPDGTTIADMRSRLAAEVKARLPEGVSPRDLAVKQMLRTGALEGQPVEYRKGGVHVLNHGVLSNDGMVLCSCSNCHGLVKLSCSQFEEHAGSTARRPAENTWLTNLGMHLKDLSLLVGSEHIDTHIGHCLLCQDGGDLLCCDGCTAAFHPTCLSIQEVPERDDWFCPECVEAGRDSRTWQASRLPPSGRRTASKRSGKEKAAAGTKAAAATSRKSPPPPYPSASPPPLPSKSSVNPGTGRVRMAAPAAYVSAARRNQRNMNKHKCLFMGEPGALRDGERVRYVVNHNPDEVLLEGSVVLGPELSGIRCDHCAQVLSCSAFEVHAGRGTRRAPYDNILCEAGITLRELALQLPEPSTEAAEAAWHLGRTAGAPRRSKARQPREGSADQAEAQEEEEEEEQMVAKEEKADEDGDLSDPFAFDRGCMLCGQTDFERDEFGPRTIIICDQCECEYHVSCLRQNNMCDLQALPDGDWFCGSGCQRIKDTLVAAVTAGDTPISDNGHSWVIMHGRNGTTSTGKLLRTVLDILQESFDPIIELGSGDDLLPYMVRAEHKGDWDYSGMYALLLRHQKRPVCAALFRVYGSRLAELPLVATRQAARRQGHAKVLVEALERMLTGAGVEQLMLPAAHETVKTWQAGFGFQHMPEEELESVTQDLRVLIFPGTQVMRKRLEAPAATPAKVQGRPTPTPGGSKNDTGKQESNSRSEAATEQLELDSAKSPRMRTPRNSGPPPDSASKASAPIFSPEL